MPSPPLTIEGLTPDQLLALPPAEFDALILTDSPIAFRAGTAHVLGQFTVRNHTLHMTLTHIDGGGEGVLPALSLLADRVVTQRDLSGSEWIVHAANCAKPNPKLRRVLERKKFERVNLNGTEVFRLSKPAPGTTP